MQRLNSTCHAQQKYVSGLDGHHHASSQMDSCAQLTTDFAGETNKQKAEKLLCRETYQYLQGSPFFSIDAIGLQQLIESSPLKISKEHAE